MKKPINVYSFLLMSQQDFLKNQVLEELLRERSNYYITKNRIRDFWIVMSPDFVNEEEFSNKIAKSSFYNQKKHFIEYAKLINKNKKAESFYVALITTNTDFMKWIQLRLGYFENINNLENSQSKFISDGLCGTIEIKDSSNLLLLKGKDKYIHPSLLLNNYEKSLINYYLN